MDPLTTAQIDQFDQVLRTTRSVRRHLDFERPLPPQVLRDCIDVAVQAPTGLAGENWRFLVVTDPVQKGAVADLYEDVLVQLLAEREMPMKASHKALVERLHEIPAMIFVCVDGEPLADTAAADIAFYGSIMPAAWSL
ncbi:MAG: nitroreductase family protein, partial [Pseudomonadota bacterium]